MEQKPKLYVLSDGDGGNLYEARALTTQDEVNALNLQAWNATAGNLGWGYCPTDAYEQYLAEHPDCGLPTLETLGVEREA
jgi:hypothetical protein